MKDGKKRSFLRASCRGVSPSAKNEPKDNCSVATQRGGENPSHNQPTNKTGGTQIDFFFFLSTRIISSDGAIVRWTLLIETLFLCDVLCPHTGQRESKGHNWVDRIGQSILSIMSHCISTTGTSLVMLAWSCASFAWYCSGKERAERRRTQMHGLVENDTIWRLTSLWELHVHTI